MKNLLLLLFLSVHAMGFSQESSDTAAIGRMKRSVSFLASDSLGGRPSGSSFEQKAADWIMGQFSLSGANGKLIPFDVPFQDSMLHCQNVVGIIDNGADSTIIICAHYDHLGMGSGKSLEIVKKGIHHGADDNSSGVAVMLELASWLVTDSSASKKYNYYFVAFTAHEIGLLGSRNFVQSDLFKPLKAKLVINLDMVGKLDHRENKIRLSYCATRPDTRNVFSANSGSSIKISFDDEHRTINDLTSFCDQNIPAISLTTGTHDDYHRLSDTADKLNYKGMERILNLLRSILTTPP